ncbi:hypothetical protein [Paraburkholderia agricolaris]|uniref:hypothetical protein n=1 Tax=Paraburkholderia agricolaris TaxID=2152888 RepID=UPI00129238BD|nr:hypothetical protein [Paraburkholderia agricolaris]
MSRATGLLPLLRSRPQVDVLRPLYAVSFFACRFNSNGRFDCDASSNGLIPPAPYFRQTPETWLIVKWSVALVFNYKYRLSSLAFGE